MRIPYTKIVIPGQFMFIGFMILILVIGLFTINKATEARRKSLTNGESLYFECFSEGTKTFSGETAGAIVEVSSRNSPDHKYVIVEKKSYTRIDLTCDDVVIKGISR